ncbi:hypothetical protein KXD93_05730 [Mucilaginibacter sp. BJC16-A38]|uniref:hypothetical protein n=1 Tax=Mucilaginibacter phenanthrenivorans TaxID=1234842 RepID=UPI002158211B|nr:hypothetical protein [Mucilaginibacter phenanthrenivorans]MCR8557130.1 hypothetical protein [Mucilaginibacter phenanthrenivorans]
MKIAVAQNNLFIARDHLVLQIDLKTSDKELDSIFKIAGVSKSNAQKLLKGNYNSIKEDGWDLATHENKIIRFDRSLSGLNENPQDAPFEITTHLPEFAGEPGYPVDVKYGVNKYAHATVFALPSGLTRFILPGYTRARRVFLSGNFNHWSTLKGAMKKGDGGWIIDVKLEPGAYEYKYIVDSRWITDPNNLQLIDDGAGNTNSLFFKYNYTIKLAGYPSAKKVVLAGDFNKWNANELLMDKKSNGWEKHLFLGDGKHIYHFLVDEKWVADPANPKKLKDDDGRLNSVLNLGEAITFKLSGHKNARNVFVAGNFNYWRPDEFSMDKTSDGWTITTTIIPGNYQYRFVVDGDWITDPANPHYAAEDGKINSFLAVRPNHTFKLKGHANAKKVTLNGSFNNWEENGYIMERKGDSWTIDFYLKPGKYLYKFRVDGEWMIDPGNKLWEQNDHDSQNSVLWIE